MKTQNTLISVKQISFTYPSLRDPTLEIKSIEITRSEKVFVYGPSGCGKTTFLELLAGVLTPQKGSISILGKDFSVLNASARDSFRAAHIGYIFQNFNLIPYLSVEENIQLPILLSPERKARLPDASSTGIKNELRLLCQQLGIEELIAKSVMELSVGQQQRVAVARALLGNPELILADEPTSALDFDHKEKFIDLLFKTCDLHKTTVLFVSHDQSLKSQFTRTISLPELNKVTKK